MRERIRNLVFAILIGALGVWVVSVPVFAADPICNDKSINKELREAAGCNNKDTIKKPVVNVVNLLLYLVGVVTIVMIIVSGIKMTTSAGNPGAVQKAKMTLLYAIVGLVIAILAYAIINFVLDFTTKK
ncbi:hypothetical protein IKF63_00530 [Candidatus Saccharibacteria bacterium]|nr:hypothetical protein [Candidatus Saccharibacteria bacterium]